MTENLKKLESSVSANTDVKASAEALVNGVADQLDALTHDPVAIKALASELRKSASDLGAAVVANTQPEEAAEHPYTKPKGRGHHK